MSGIFQAINLLGAFGSAIEAGKPIKLRPGYYTPGFMAVLCAFLRRRNVPAEGLLYDCPKVSGYFRAMRISQVLWGVDDYQYGRPNAGTNYAPLTHLASREAVDDATNRSMGVSAKWRVVQGSTIVTAWRSRSSCMWWVSFTIMSGHMV